MVITYDYLKDFFERYGGSVRYAGCDGFDNDADGSIDECDEDQFAPEIVLPSNDQLGIVVGIQSQS